jgi:D-alanyl-D-alanine carboxypeptidase/D-alanyl-D-alanine-endopeptidase (penicillin-binding protein 4)
LGVPRTLVSLRDASGLSHRDAVAPAALVGVIRAAISPRYPQLRAIAEGLPVAGLTGTLADRYRTKRDRGAAGVTRAKTGSLTGVDTLAGIVVDTSGRLLVFALQASHAPDPQHTEAALDRIVARLAGCGCAPAP